MSEVKADIHWPFSKGAFSAAARATLTIGEISPSRVREMETSNPTSLYVRLGQSRHGLEGFGNPTHPLFRSLESGIGELSTDYWSLYEPIHEQAGRFLATLRDSEEKERAMDQLIHLERIALAMCEYPVVVSYSNIGSEPLVHNISIPYRHR